MAGDPSNTSDLTNTGSRISKEVFLGFGFGCVAATFFFILFRLYVRWKLFRRLFWDDALVILSWTLYLGIAVSFWITRDGMFIGWYLLEHILPLNESTIALAVSQNRLALAALVLFITCLWLIKLSFLLFFRRLGARQQSRQTWWWIVTAATILSGVGLIGAMPYECATSDLQRFIAKCGTPRAELMRGVLFFCQCAADILTDALIISIPVMMLWNVRMPLKQKLSLMALFSMTILVIICAIVRIIVNIEDVGAKDMTWIAFWASIELTIAIITACLASLRQFFKAPSKHDKTATKQTMASAEYQMSNNKKNSFRTSEPEGVFNHSFARGTARLHDGYDTVEIKETSVLISQVSEAHLARSPTPTERQQLDLYEYEFSPTQKMFIGPNVV